MQLEMKQTRLSGYEWEAAATLLSEQTLESIVPDSCPDILRILQTVGHVCVRSQQVGEGRLEARGTVCAQVLYLSEEGERVERLEVAIPFSCTLEHSGLHPDSVVFLTPALQRAEARLLNPRKVYVRAQLALEVRGYTPGERALTDGCAGPAGLGVEEKREECRVHIIRSVQSKPFSFEDELLLPDGRPEPEQLLSQRVEVVCPDSKLIGSKLIFKGRAVLTLLYRGVEGELATAAFDLPFSQIMEVGEAGEGSQCELEVAVSELTCRMDGERPRLFAVSLAFEARAVVREVTTARVLTDLYSTLYPTRVQRARREVCVFSEELCLRQEVRERLESPVEVERVVDAWFHLGNVSQSWEGRQLRLDLEVQVKVLYRREGGEYDCLHRVLSVSCCLEGDPVGRSRVRARLTGEHTLTPVPGALELRLPLELLCRNERGQEVEEVVQAETETEPWDPSQRPSVVLRRMEEGESLWQLAKRCVTTVEEIRQANGLSPEEEGTGKLLLIPKKR